MRIGKAWWLSAVVVVVVAAVVVGLLAVIGSRRDRPQPSASVAQPSASVALSALPPPSGAPAAPLVVPGKVLVGAYLSLSGRTLPESLALRRQQVGRDPRILHLFYAWQDRLPDRYPEVPAGSIPMISWEGTAYRSVNDGSSDTRIAANAQALARYGKPVFLRWAWEMNGDWYGWGGAANDRNTDGFIAAWRRIHDIFRANNATNVVWVWSPNHHSAPDEDWNGPDRYYPGDEYVDWVGVSGYNTRREAPAQLFDAIYDEFAARKPVMLAEVGAVDRGGRTKAQWIDLLAQWITAHPAVAAVVWFDTDTHPETDENWRVDVPSNTLDAYRRIVTDPRFVSG